MSKTVRLKVARYGYNLAGHYRTTCDKTTTTQNKQNKKENTHIGIHPEEGLDFFPFLVVMNVQEGVIAQVVCVCVCACVRACVRACVCSS